jgi:hypothetical protein
MTFHSLRLIGLPLAILLIGWTTPFAVMTYRPDMGLFNDDLIFWWACITYIAMSLAAIKVTFTRLIILNPANEPISSDLIQTTTIQSYARSVTLFIMALGLLSLPLYETPTDFGSLLLFISLRLGFTLLGLGGIVLYVTHLKMRRL